MKLIVQPDAGIAPIVTSIKQAKKSIDILIFRLDRFEIARALAAAVARGVRVRALTAHTNRGGTKSLRKLEMSLLEAGVTVSRTADDLVRYHGQMMIHGPRHCQEPKLWSHQQEQKADCRSEQAFYCGLRPSALLGRLRTVRRQPRQCARAAREVHRRRT
jgi:hypothetical protein